MAWGDASMRDNIVIFPGTEANPRRPDPDKTTRSIESSSGERSSYHDQRSGGRSAQVRSRGAHRLREPAQMFGYNDANRFDGAIDLFL